MWFDGSLYVAAPPSIWKLTDTDDDGVADRREEWFARQDADVLRQRSARALPWPGWLDLLDEGCLRVADLREAGQGAAGDASRAYLQAPTGQRADRAGDDRRHGQPCGGRLHAGRASGFFTSTFVEHPRPADATRSCTPSMAASTASRTIVIDGHPQTGDLMPVAVASWAPRRPSGLMRYQSRVFGAGLPGQPLRRRSSTCRRSRDTCCRPMARPSRRRTRTSSSRPTATSIRPTCSKTPTAACWSSTRARWYKLCCPTSQLAKPDVLGAIYRVRAGGAARPRDPRGLGLDWPALPAGRLGRRSGRSAPGGPAAGDSTAGEPTGAARSAR